MIIGAVRLPAFCATDVASRKGRQFPIYAEIW